MPQFCPPLPSTIPRALPESHSLTTHGVTSLQIAQCIEGGPITRVESETMDKIVSGVTLYGDKKNDESDSAHGDRITVERLTWQEFKAQWHEYEDAQRDPFGKYTGGFEGQFAVRVRKPCTACGVCGHVHVQARC